MGRQPTSAPLHSKRKTKPVPKADASCLRWLKWQGKGSNGTRLSSVGLVAYRYRKTVD